MEDTINKKYSYEQKDIPQNLENIISKINNNNIEESAVLTLDFYDEKFPYSFHLLIYYLIYSYSIQPQQDSIIYLNYLKYLEEKEEEINKNKFQVIEQFKEFLLKYYSNESLYLLAKMVDEKFIDSTFPKKRIYFAHLMTSEEIKKENYEYSYFIDNYDELSKNDWELHKKYVKEGHNPNEIAQIIRNDEIEKLQEISSQTNFYFNRTIKPSLYERCSFINQENVTLIDYAAFFSSINCFLNDNCLFVFSC